MKYVEYQSETESEIKHEASEVKCSQVDVEQDSPVEGNCNNSMTSLRLFTYFANAASVADSVSVASLSRVSKDSSLPR